MSIEAASVMTRQRKSFVAGQEAAAELRSKLTGPPKVVITHLTINHQQPRFLEGLRSVFGAEVPLIGCSGQGVMGKGGVHEEGYAATVLALGGADMHASVARVDDIATDTTAKGAALARTLREGIGATPKVTLLYYDPLPGADISHFLGQVDEHLGGPIIGAAAAHFFSTKMTTTFQYFGGEVFSHGAVAVSLSGNFQADLAYSSGVAAGGINMTVTKASGTMIQELDGRPAMEVWREVTGSTGPADPVANAALGIGLPVDDDGGGYMIRAAFVIGEDAEGLMLQTAAREGTRVALFHRTVEDVLQGSATLAADLKKRLEGRSLRAVVGFECGARTGPFLGTEATNEENQALQSCLGDAAYAGVVCWGEIFPVAGRTHFHNYAYPVLALSE